MKRSNLLLGIFGLVAAAQLAVPASMLWRHEDTLRNGRAYKFRTAPVDPYDAFRGRYVALNFADTEAPIREGDKLDRQQKAYVWIEEAPNGFVRFVELSNQPPSTGDYLRVEDAWGRATNGYFRLPFDRFYMEESAAPQAERAYWQYGNRANRTNNQTYVVVRVKGGRGVIEDLYIKDQPIREFIKTMPK